MRSSAVVRACLLAAVTLTAFVASLRISEAQPADLFAGVIDGTFEATGDGWAATVAGQVVIDGDGPVHAGSRAARVEATRTGQAGARTKYWLVPTVPGVAHTARLWLYDDDPGTSAIEVELAFLRADGTTRNAYIEPVGSGTGGWQPVTITLTGVEGTAYASVEVRATATGAGARFYLDDVTLERDPVPPPAPTGTSTGTPVATLPASPTATPTSTPASGPTTTPSATSTPPPTATAAATPALFEVLTNGDFSAGLYGWSDIGADVEAAGGAARMTSGSTSTKYLYQAVRIEPGGWYEAGAYLAPGPGVDAAWMRVAWYASIDGSGSQLGTVDSPAVSGTGSVRTGAVQAPLEAHSAHIRVMLRPLGGGFAELTVDDVWFESTSPPPQAAPTAAASGTAVSGTGGAGGGTTAPPSSGGPPTPAAGTAAPRSAEGAAPEGAAGSTSGGARAGSGSSDSGVSRPTAGGSATATGVGGSAPAAPRIEGSAAEILLRITELMPDAVEPGNDSEFEWVEVSNVGATPVRLAGIVLRDNAGVVALPDVVLATGASIVVAGPRATVPQASAFWPTGGISNGLGSSGDRLALIAADGRVIDALSYGSDATYDNPPLPAPGAGRSLKRFFGDDGTYAGYEVSSEPSPGRFEPPPARLADTAAAADGGATGGAEGSGATSAAYVLGGLAVIALAGVAGQRLWALRRGGGGPAADGA